MHNHLFSICQSTHEITSKPNLIYEISSTIKKFAATFLVSFRKTIDPIMVTRVMDCGHKIRPMFITGRLSVKFGSNIRFLIQFKYYFSIFTMTMGNYEKGETASYTPDILLYKVQFEVRISSRNVWVKQSYLTKKHSWGYSNEQELYYLICFIYDFLNIIGSRKQAGLRSKCTD